MELKFKIGDKVETNDGLIGIIDEIDPNKYGFTYWISVTNTELFYCKEEDLKPYVKPEEQNKSLIKASNIIKDRSTKREKAIELINAYFEGKDIIMKDPEHGVPNWVSIHDSYYWSYLGQFIREIDKYKIVEE